MALSLLCGGLGVAEAAVVHVDEVPGGTKAVYTTDETYTMTQADAKYATQAALGDYAKSAEVYSKTEADAKYATQTALGDYAKSAEVYSKTEADAKYATQAALGDYAKSAEVYSKTEADAKYATQAALGDYAKSAEVYSKTEADAKYATQAALGDYAKSADVNNALSAKADKTDLDTANGRIDALQTKTTGLSPDGKSLTGMDKVETGTLKVTGEISNDAGVHTTVEEIATSIEQTNTNKANIQALDTKVGTVGTDTNYLDPKNSIGENLGILDAGLKKEVDERKAAIGELAVDGTYNYIEHNNNVSDNLVKLDNRAKANADEIVKTNDRTKGITRETDGTKTTTRIEGNVTVDNRGNVGGVKELSAETIKAKTITTTNDATIDGALNVNGASNLNGNVTLGTDATNTVTVKGTADFNAAVNMNNGLNVTNGATTLKETTVNGKLDVSDTDGNNKANLSVKAGDGVKASADNGTTKGSLDVKADEVKTEVKDDSTGNHTNTSQTADGIKGYATDKDGNKTYTKVTATENSFQVQDKDGNIKNHQVNTKDKSENTIKNGDKTNIVTSTADGTTFNNSEAAAPVTGASGAGTHLNTTIKGNTITTGKVTMDYADVMKDLGVKGNTTLGEAGKDTTLTVNSKATFNNGLTVTNGETKLKNTTIEGTLNVFENATFKKDVTAKSFSVNGKTYIDSDGLNANNQVIRNVADGSISEGSKDAVNGGQLYTVKNDLEGKVNKVGANAAAMANLHPMEFDPDSKWNIAAAIGNYGSETAAALGAFYRPNDDVMVNLSTAFGTGENMVGGGVSVRLGKGGNKLSREESNALKDQVNDLTARMDALLSVLNPNMSKDFPDVPENHWAYEAVSRLAGNDIVQGYPDGEFHGERTMTRYEMAEIIYNALSRGAEAEKELVEEFKPELQAMAASEKATAERAEG